MSTAFAMDVKVETQTRALCGQVLPWGINVETHTGALCRQLLPWGINVETHTGALCRQLLQWMLRSKLKLEVNVEFVFGN